MELIDYPDTDAMMLGLARRVTGDLRAALARRERVLFAVPGGTSPGPLFDLLSAADLDWLLLHQANQRIIDAVADRLEIPREKTLSNLAQYGNTSAASIPLALDEAVRAGQVKPGDVIAASGFGAGLTWGAAVFRWGRLG